MSLKFSVGLVLLFAVAVALLAAAAVKQPTEHAKQPAEALAPRAAGPVADTAEPRAPGSDAGPAGSTQVAAVTPPRPRVGRRLALDEAMRELDLIRPSRQKLAEDWVLATPDAATFRLSGHRGKVVLLNFWATWCPPCLQEMPAMERLYRRHKAADFVLVAVSVDADPKKVAPFLAEHKLTFPVALDPNMTLAERYGVRALPSSFVVDRRGYLVALALGPRHWDNDAAHSLVEALTR